MKTILSTVFFAVFVLSAAASKAADEWTGKWTMTSMTLKVNMESWGENCGPKPASYTSKQQQSVEISAQGKHLIFSKGGVRTDRCGSPNPRLQVVSQSAASGNWRRVCQTDGTDPKYERGEYSLAAIGSDRLEYKAVSRFDWTLKGDHCIAGSQETRIYVRDIEESKKPKDDQLEVKGEKEEQTGESDLSADNPACEKPGPAKRLSIRPSSHQLGPGERICFTAFAIDQNGCRSEVEASWTASQDGKAMESLISKGGCFKAGDTAADSEGLYKITARAAGRSDSAEVTVVFPDLGELLAARLKPIEDLQAEVVQDNGAEFIPKIQSPLKLVPTKTNKINNGQTVSANESKGSSSPTRLILGAVLLGLAIAISVFVRKKMVVYKKPVDLDDDSARAEDAESFSSKPDVGMVCPRCHRGYDASARFCPHDADKLVPYSEWRKRNRSTPLNIEKS